MKKKFTWILLPAIFLLTCKEKDPELNPPVLEEVFPTQAAPGEYIELYGTFLNSVSDVSFNTGLEKNFMAPLYQDETSIYVMVPEMNAGMAQISVENSDGVSNSLQFRVLAKTPVISSFAPTKGMKKETVIITGQYLEQVTAVRFNGGTSSNASFKLDRKTLTVTVPDDAVSGKICITTPSGQKCSASDFIVVAEPSIASISRDYGVKDFQVEIKGQNLNNATVKFGSISATASYNDATTIRVNCPEFTSVQQVSLSVTTAGGQVSRNFTGAPAAQITKAIPNGFIPGSVLTLKGVNFYNIQSVQLPSGKSVSPGDFIRNESNDITFKVPAGTSPGDVKIVSQYGDGQALNLSVITGGSGLNADNIATSTTTISLATTNLCNDGFLVFCRKADKGAVYSYFRVFTRTNPSDPCYLAPTLEIINGVTFEIFPNKKDPYGPVADYILKFEKDSKGLYTGLVIMIRNARTYIGNRAKDGLIFYAIDDGTVEKLCYAVPTNNFEPGGFALIANYISNPYWNCNCN